MELIGKQIAIETILGQPPELHYPSWYAAQIEKLPPAPPEYLAEQAGILVTDADTISRQAAIEALGTITVYKGSIPFNTAMMRIKQLPPAQPERTPMQELLDVTADRDYWKAQCHSYEMTINRLTESAQPERIIHCKDCEWWTKQECSPQGRCALFGMYPTGGWFCGNARRREVAT